MLEVPVYNTNGERLEALQVDEAAFGAVVNVDLLKQAIVTYRANRRQGSATTRGRSEVHGSTRKLFRQKGTGYARRGAIRTNIQRGGGVTFAKKPGSFRKALPRKMRKAALRSAILAKMLGRDMLVVDGLRMEEPKTREMARVLNNLKIDRSCLLVLPDRDRGVHLSARNIPGLTVRVIEDLNAFDVATRQKLVVTCEVMKKLIGQEATA